MNSPISLSYFRRGMFARPREMRENLLLGLMLLLLHAALWGDFGSALSRSMMLAHLGLFLIWQPLWRSDRRLDRGTSTVFVLLTVAFVVWLNWWFVFIWMLLLIGLIGGRVLFVNRRERFVYLTTLVVLICEFLIGCVVPTFDVPTDDFTGILFYYGLMVPALLVLVLPVHHDPRPRLHSVDFLHAITLSSLTALLALGSLLVMYSTELSYPTALFQNLIFIALFLLAISWLLDPHPGFSGLSQLWSGYVLNMGTPFEEWLTGLSQLAQRHDAPDAFLKNAMAQFGDLPWVEGTRWETREQSGLVGRETPHANRVQGDTLEVTVYTLAAPGATLLLHSRLLIQVIDYFYTAKRSQQELGSRAHLQAVYETGARVTHDIKNLLQSLQTLTMAMEHTEGRRAEQAYALVRRQLPQLGQRLGRALDKLQSPETEEPLEHLALDQWWRRLKRRHEEAGLGFEAAGEIPVTEVRADVLDTALENLLENARFKRQSEPHIRITVSLDPGPPLTVTVCDTGSPVPPAVAERLFRQPVDSTSGLGIGLYQTARLAESAGYELRILHNARGRICMGVLKSPADRPNVDILYSNDPGTGDPSGRRA
ncbi:MAG: HAMP domain-containing sensor histidine kinase [Gammaproteobacteria bacterium]|nr:HAMP domain-containing sensor histidine kinase [Gammaproteobacteria bacterium]